MKKAIGRARTPKEILAKKKANALHYAHCTSEKAKAKRERGKVKARSLFVRRLPGVNVVDLDKGQMGSGKYATGPYWRWKAGGDHPAIVTDLTERSVTRAEVLAKLA